MHFYDCDQVGNDYDVIQGLLDNATNKGGDEVILPAGHFYIGAPGGINHPLKIGSNTTLRGAGKGATIIHLANDVAMQDINGSKHDTALMLCNAGSYAVNPKGTGNSYLPLDHDITIKDLTFDCNKNNQPTVYGPESLYSGNPGTLQGIDLGSCHVATSSVSLLPGNTYYVLLVLTNALGQEIMPWCARSIKVNDGNNAVAINIPNHSFTSIGGLPAFIRPYIRCISGYSSDVAPYDRWGDMLYDRQPDIAYTGQSYVTVAQCRPPQYKLSTFPALTMLPPNVASLSDLNAEGGTLIPGVTYTACVSPCDANLNEYGCINFLTQLISTPINNAITFTLSSLLPQGATQAYVYIREPSDPTLPNGQQLFSKQGPFVLSNDPGIGNPTVTVLAKGNADTIARGKTLQNQDTVTAAMCFDGCRDVTIENVDIIDSALDGIMIGNQGGSFTYNVTYRGGRIAGCVREAISVVGPARKIMFDGLDLTMNTSCVDLEPPFADEIYEDITFRNCRFYGSMQAEAFAIGPYKGTPFTGVKIENCTFDCNQVSLRVSYGGQAIGSIFSGCTFKNMLNVGVNIMGGVMQSGTIRDCLFIGGGNPVFSQLPVAYPGAADACTLIIDVHNVGWDISGNRFIATPLNSPKVLFRQGVSGNSFTSNTFQSNGNAQYWVVFGDGPSSQYFAGNSGDGNYSDYTGKVFPVV